MSAPTETETETETAIEYGDLTPYTLGKFQKLADEIAYECSMGGELDFCGDAEYDGHYTLCSVWIEEPAAPVEGESDFYRFQREQIAALQTIDRQWIESHPYAIVQSVNSGAVYVGWYETEEAARAAYDPIEVEINKPRCYMCGNLLTAESLYNDEPRYSSYDNPICKDCAPNYTGNGLQDAAADDAEIAETERAQMAAEIAYRASLEERADL